MNNVARGTAVLAALTVFVALPVMATAEDVAWLYDDTAHAAEIRSSMTIVASGGIETFGLECVDSNGLCPFRTIPGSMLIIVR